MSQETLVAESQYVPTLEDNLRVLSDDLQRLETEIDSLAGSDQYPEWWFATPVSGVEFKAQLKASDPATGQVSQYYDMFKKQKELDKIITGREGVYGGRYLDAVTYQLGPETVGKAFAAEPSTGSLHQAMLEQIGGVADDPWRSSPTSQLQVLCEAYGRQSMTELLGIGGDEYSDTLRPLLKTEYGLKWMRYNDQKKFQVGDKEADTQAASYEWMSQALSAGVGIGQAEAADYVYSASRIHTDASILKVIDTFDHFGVERMRAITQFTGIHGLEGYSIEQLERMEALVVDPEQEAARLAGHDVNVVMINRFGDHNGVLENAAATVDDDNSVRTLFFEITSMGDIYRHILQLQKLGIKPSTLILSAHSSDGGFVVADLRNPEMKRKDVAAIAGRTLIRIANYENQQSKSLDYGYSMHGMKGMGRLVEDLMQPSRAIDDAAADAGKKKIIFQACSAASEIDMNDKTEAGERFVIGIDSVVGQLGADLLASGVKSDVDIYGAATGIQLARNERGIHFTGQPSSFFLENGRPQIAAERVRLENGKLVKQSVDEVVLREVA